MSSVLNTNAVSDRDFAQFDRLLREKPTASILARDGMIAFANNKTSDWLQAKRNDERKVIIDSAQKSAGVTRDLFRVRTKAERNS